MQLFYGEQEDERIVLSAEEAQHADKVLRKRPGDIIHVCNGQHTLFTVQLESISSKRAIGLIKDRQDSFGRVPGHLSLAIAPTKNMDRLEWAVEKGVELGVSSFHLILCERSERKHASEGRLQKIALAAAKQSVKGHVPRVHSLTPWSTFVQQWGSHYGKKGMAHCMELPKQTLGQWNPPPFEKTLVVIGPEGDFTPKEWELAAASSFQGLSLGSSRLRTETAAVQIAAVLMNAWDKQ